MCQNYNNIVAYKIEVQTAFLPFNLQNCGKWYMDGTSKVLSSTITATASAFQWQRIHSFTQHIHRPVGGCSQEGAAAPFGAIWARVSCPERLNM